ncbi:FG-GAP-like repeat-containing protein [Kitasatospora sp. HPMI-4]|uniref:FG-GAP-like repeat-containing protein n=1 Tax=Kitasatospora sp. HPMI-4 TaxID=3448443 RepID=UPI003F1B3C0F
MNIARLRSGLVLAAACLLAASGVTTTSGTAFAASVATWDQVAQCESTGNWSIVSSDGLYYGGLQITLANWQSYGGTAYAARPDLASKAQQVRIAEKILADQGPGAWPVCSRGTALGTDHAVPYSGAATESGSGRVRFADWDGDGRADYIVVNDDGSVHVYLNRGGDGHGGWLDDGVVATGLTTDKSRVRFADWDGDGRADYIAINPDGKIHVMLNRGGAGHGGWQDAGIVAQGTTTNPDQVRFADIDGDGKTDYVTIADDGIVSAYLNRGGDTGGGWVADGQIATGVTTDRSRVRLADIDGDGRADYVVLNPDGSVTAYVNNGGVGHFNGWSLRPKIASGVTTNQNLVDFADLNGDGLADYLVTNGPTHAFINNGGEDVRNPGWIDWGQVAAGGV